MTTRTYHGDRKAFVVGPRARHLVRPEAPSIRQSIPAFPGRGRCIGHGRVHGDLPRWHLRRPPGPVHELRSRDRDLGLTLAAMLVVPLIACATFDFASFKTASALGFLVVGAGGSLLRTAKSSPAATTVAIDDRSINVIAEGERSRHQRLARSESDVSRRRPL